MKIRPPWERYWPKNSADWNKLSDVTHVTHIANAVSIAEKGRVLPALTCDTPQLRKRRIEVVWVSPNHWHPGFRYGHVAFHFPWSVVHKKYAYWIGAVRRRTTACQFLLTDVDRSEKLPLYDPAVHRGPWRRNAAGKHFWNSHLAMEFLVEDDLDLDDVSRTAFVDHQRDDCSEGGCREQSLSDARAGALFLATAISRELDLRGVSLVNLDAGQRKASVELRKAAMSLRDQIRALKPKRWGLAKGTSSRASPLARAVMLSLANRNKDEATILAGGFTDGADLHVALEHLLCEAFGVNRILGPPDAPAK